MFRRVLQHIILLCLAAVFVQQPSAWAQSDLEILQNWGKETLANAPANVRAGDPILKAHYAMTKYCEVLQKHGVGVNKSLWNRLQQAARNLEADRWTCSDHAIKLGAVFKGFGIKKTLSVMGEKEGAPGLPQFPGDLPPNAGTTFDVNSNHGALAVMHKGKAFVFDPWQLAAQGRGSYAGADTSTWNGMPAEKWEREMRNQGYIKFAGEGDEPKSTLTAALERYVADDLKPYQISGTWKLYSGGEIGSSTENKVFYTGTLVVNARPYEDATATVSFGTPETMQGVQATERSIVFTRPLGQVVQRYRGWRKDDRHLLGTFSHLGPNGTQEFRWWAERP